MVNRGGAKYGREREREEFSLGGNEYVPCVHKKVENPKSHQETKEVINCKL